MTKKRTSSQAFEEAPVEKKTYKAIVDDHFIQVSELVYQCKLCQEPVTKNKQNGFQNVASHYDKCLREQKEKEKRMKGQSLIQFPQSEQSKYWRKFEYLYKWADWVITDNLSFSFVESPGTRKYCNESLKPVSRRGFGRFMSTLYLGVKDYVASILPEKFGLLFDGWSKGTRHFVAIFAAWQSMPESRPVLLAFGKLPVAGNQNANNHVELLSLVLSSYNKSMLNVSYMVADNTNLNPAIADISHVNFIGCAAHRLNLALRQFIKNHFPGLVVKIQTFHTKLRTCNMASVLTADGIPTPKLANATRWLSVFNMLQSFLDTIDQIDLNKACYRSIAQYMPSDDVVDQVKALKGWLEPCQILLVQIQRDGFTLQDVRAKFAELMKINPILSSHLASDSPIVKNRWFESSIAQCIKSGATVCDYQALSSLLPAGFVKPDAESQVADEVFLFADYSNVAIDLMSPPSEASQLFQASVREPVEQVEFDILKECKSIPATTCIVERLFSHCKLLLTEQRSSMTDDTLQKLIFLKGNQRMWRADQILKVMKAPVSTMAEDEDLSPKSTSDVEVLVEDEWTEYEVQPEEDLSDVY
ncbi:hypothetical protein MP228_005012 [Amoeboaphelidium protococcarum]|nr:hypothetical protein MP228_012455 [Amoeboaphelidium protococcarum]KAI3650133.1 hypothetical protein MP228_005012 [Amoeboaphelidium protococcarum]